MKLDVLLVPGEVTPGDVEGRLVVVIDVLRATSSMVEALAAGARTIYPAGTVEEALRIAASIGRDVLLLCGERNAVRVDGFDLGNSPREFTSERVGGKSLVMSTTNGTALFGAAAAAASVIAASFLNLSATVERIAGSGLDPLLVCAGRRKHFALEDAVCAGMIAQRVMDRGSGDWQTTDGVAAALELARCNPSPEELLPRTDAGRELIAAGLADDLPFCAQQDRHALVPELRGHTLVAAPAESG